MSVGPLAILDACVLANFSLYDTLSGTMKEEHPPWIPRF